MKAAYPAGIKAPSHRGQSQSHSGITMHTLCVIDGPLAMYKLYAQTSGGKTDTDIESCHINVPITQKWVNLMLVILDDFKGKGHCTTTDSTYMGYIIAQIGHKEWKLNMVAHHNQI
jgi:hypothetical protein